MNDPVNFQLLFNIAFALACGAGGWILNNITKAVDRLDKDVREMPMTYVSKADYRDDIRDMKDTLERIWNKMDGKADK